MSHTLAEQLMIRPHTTVWLSDPAHIALFTPMPDGVREAASLATSSTAVLFAEDADGARRQLADHRADLAKPSALWIAYPPDEAAGLDPDTLASIVAGHDLRLGEPVTIDDSWAGLRLRAIHDGTAERS